MKKTNEKLKKWEKRDVIRTVSYFAIHTAIIMLLFAFALAFSTDFDMPLAWEHIANEGVIGTIFYLVISVCLISGGMFLYLWFEDRDFLYEGKNVNMLFVILEVSMLMMYAIGKWRSVYARPFALCALLVLMVSDRRKAVYMNCVVCLLVFMSDAFVSVDMNENRSLYATLVIGFITSTMAIYLVDGKSARFKVLILGFPIALPVVCSCLLLNVDTIAVHWADYLIDGVASGLLSVILMTLWLPLFEEVFSALTNYRLAELTDHKAPLIKALIENAPGTFNHSVALSTLAESCATAIGENPLLARACAYYHDVGKLKNPEFFTENQTGRNLHDELTPELSTEIIRSHAKDGYELILKYRLPKILADVALQHHGTLPIRYFYVKATKYTDGELDIAKFSYAGPKPQTKIAAIIMIADGCEAKVRTLKDRTADKVEVAVRDIIEERMSFGQFDECDLTMKDIDVIRHTITRALAGIYHGRVEYPKLKIGNHRSEGGGNE